MMSCKLLVLLGSICVSQIQNAESKSVKVASPYDEVGLCEPYKNLIDKSFSICKVAGKGDYYYYISNKFDKTVTCAKAQIDADKKHGSATVYNPKNPKGVQTVYDLVGSSEGVILEDFTPKGSKTTYHFKLLVTGFDETYGVMSYIRCSDSGTKKNFASFSTVIKETTLTDATILPKALEVVKTHILKAKIKAHEVKQDCLCEEGDDDGISHLDYIYTQ